MDLAETFDIFITKEYTVPLGTFCWALLLEAGRDTNEYVHSTLKRNKMLATADWEYYQNFNTGPYLNSKSFMCYSFSVGFFLLNHIPVPV